MRGAIEERFWAKVDKRSGCWIWTAARYHGGHGQIRVGGKLVRAHRLSWELTNGHIPNGLHVCHRCDVPECVRPDHLFLGTHADNMADMSKKGRGTKGPKDSALRGRNRGTNNGAARLTEDRVRLARELHAAGVPLRSIGKQAGVGAVAIFKLVHRQTWRHV